MYLAVVLWPCNTSCVIIDLAQAGLGGGALMGPCMCVAYTYSHGHIYMFICMCVCLGPSVTREMDVLASSESPAGGEASEAAPWQ